MTAATSELLFPAIVGKATAPGVGGVTPPAVTIAKIREPAVGARTPPAS
ncbi:hypothetical protein ABZ922_19885 [Streptomyces shenzhenensis]